MISILCDAAALFLLWLFVFSGMHKCRGENAEYYKGVVSGYGFDSAAEHPIAIKALGALEIFAGIAIFLPALRDIGAVLIALVLMFYLVLISVQLMNGRKEMECGCAGPLGGTKVGMELVVRNIILFGVALFCIGFNSSSLANINAVALSLVFSLLIIIYYLCSEQLIANSQKLKLLAGR